MGASLEVIPKGIQFALAKGSLLDTSELASWFDKHHQHLYCMALRLLGQPADAEDVLQETFLKAWRAITKKRIKPDHTKAWLTRILVNTCHDRFRRNAARPQTQPLDPNLPLNRHSESAVLANQTLQVALQQLSMKSRAVVILHELDELDTKTISQLMGMKPVTVRWHLSKGLKKLAQWLEKEEVSRG